MACDFIFCLLDGIKCDLCVVQQNIFQCVARTYELVFCLLRGRKTGFDDVGKEMIRRVNRSYEIILSLVACINATCANSRKRYNEDRL